MSGFYKPNIYVKKDFDRSLYRPRRMSKNVTNVNDEIRKLCNNLRNIQTQLSSLSGQLNSGAFYNRAYSLNNQIGRVNSNVSYTAANATQNLLYVCNTIASHNSILRDAMVDINSEMNDAAQTIEKFFHDGRF